MCQAPTRPQGLVARFASVTSLNLRSSFSDFRMKNPRLREMNSAAPGDKLRSGSVAASQTHVSQFSSLCGIAEYSAAP